MLLVMVMMVMVVVVVVEVVILFPEQMTSTAYFMGTTVLYCNTLPADYAVVMYSPT